MGTKYFGIRKIYRNMQYASINDKICKNMEGKTFYSESIDYNSNCGSLSHYTFWTVKNIHTNVYYNNLVPTHYL